MALEYKDARELVRIRHTLRALAARGDRVQARTLLERMWSLAARDAAESAALQTEMSRWRAVFGLERTPAAAEDQ